MRSSGAGRGALEDHSHTWKMGHYWFWWQIAMPSNHTLGHMVSQGKLGSPGIFSRTSHSYDEEQVAQTAS